ncbi:hepatitis A virus cellular receptor 2-like [Hippocampus comes]|uniref:hepatitis A virus cellular receptor 2-like n=1 Tax=Hippocampus comes TaxID=109280 RepID=UPI00094E7560|nr:PREDICTED: hepatitis A virus cellular receptor 2-like [Hippocampus comes]
MASGSARHRLTPQIFAAVLLLLSDQDPYCKSCKQYLHLTAGGVAHVSCFKVPEGGVASLSCQYSVKRFGLSRVCWGRGCGTLWCSNILIQTDENGVISKADDRYRLTGDVLEGQMDLDIADVRRSDSGPYCCRVDIDGLFNDKKVIMNLRVVKASINSPTTTLSTTSTATTQVTEVSTSAVNRQTLPRSPQLDLVKRNSTILHSTTITVVNPSATLSLHVNVPVLSLSLTVLITLAAVFLSLAFKRGLYRRSGCFSSEEPPRLSLLSLSVTFFPLCVLAVNRQTLPRSPQLDLVKRNSTILHSTTITVVNPSATLSLHVNVPVLSLSLTVLITLAAVFLSLAFKRGLYRRSGCFSSEEPPHIIYEIRMRRPVQENIYTLD